MLKQTPAFRKLIKIMSVKVTTLPNGLRVVTDYVPSVESVAVGVWVGVGTRNEDLSYNGAAHMVEHMLFKGTKNRDARAISEVIENVGGHINAYTSREITSYHIHLLKNDLPLAVDVLADIVQNSTMPADEVERERDVILQEIGMCFDTPDDIVFDNHVEAAYPNQAFGAPILGTNEIIKNMKRDTLMDYVNRFYTPARMVICASGNLDHDDFIKEIENKFDSMPANQDHKEVPANYQGGETRETRELEQSHIVLGFKGIPRTNNDYYTAQILATLMGGGMSSRLFQEVREKRGLVYSIYSYHSAHKDTGQFNIYAGTGPDKLPELIPVICEEIKKIGGAITESELNRAKAQISSSTLMARESMMSRADQNAKSLLVNNKMRSVDEIIKNINAVDIKALENIAQQIFSSAPTLAALGPLEELESFDKIKSRLA